jgi:signal peptidase I
MKLLRRALSVTALMVLLAGAVIPLAWTAAARADLVRSARVLTGSMAPHMPEGSLALGTPAQAEDLKTGDVIMFRPPPPFGEPGGLPVVHRVDEIAEVNGIVEVHTKGDANDLPDPWSLDAGRSTIYKVRVVLPGVGRGVEFAGRSSAQVLMALPVLLLAACVLRLIWRSGGRHMTFPSDSHKELSRDISLLD